jgi:hypothetical protein
VKWQTRRVPDTRPKPDGYGYGYEFLPTGTGMSTNFYPQPLCWRAGNCSTRPEPDPLPSLLDHYRFNVLHAWCGDSGGKNNFDLTALCGMPSVSVGNRSAYVSWDGVHHTEPANHFIADGWLRGPYVHPPMLSVDYSIRDPLASFISLGFYDWIDRGGSCSMVSEPRS